MRQGRWTCAILALFVLLVGCRGVSDDELPPVLPPPAPKTPGALTMDATTAADIYLAGAPPEMMVDEAGQIVVASGLENVGVGTIVLLKGGGVGVRPEAIAKYEWVLETPPGSAASLDDTTSRTPSFRPDVAGVYSVTLSIENEGGITGEPANVAIRAGYWVGNGSIRGASDHPSQCAGCHPENLWGWGTTRHAVTLQRAMDGQASPFYLENCIHCHTVGNNAIAVNGGFDDVATGTGLALPGGACTRQL